MIMGLKIVTLIIWVIVGLANLIFFKQIDKVSYGLAWSVLVIQLVSNLIE